MRILKNTEILDNTFDGSVVTIGNFDGVHRGHAELFKHLRIQSKKLGLPSVVVTFEPHPLKLIAPETAPRLITNSEQKAKLIADSGIDYLVVIAFTQAFSQLEAADFVRDFLCKTLGMRHIIIGHDYAFGRGRQGNYDTLKQMGTKLGFSIESIEPVGERNAVFSSSLIRSMISAGDVAGATAILGRYHVLSGRVVHGREIGVMLGFPTANINTCNELIPSNGVYAVLATVDDELFQGACNIGTCPTFEGVERTIEVFLIDFSGQLYDRELAFCFVDRIRNERKFSGAAELVKAIADDVSSARKILSVADRSKIKVLYANCPTEIVE